MALPISISRRRTDIGTGWDARIDEMAADLALIEETTQKFTYDFATLGGVAGTTINLGALPPNAVITAAWYDLITGLTTGGTVTASLGVNTDAAAGFVAALSVADATGVWATPGQKGTLVGSFPRSGGTETALVVAAGQAATCLKVGATARQVELILAGTAPADNVLTGRFNLFISYYISV